MDDRNVLYNIPSALVTSHKDISSLPSSILEVNLVKVSWSIPVTDRWTSQCSTSPSVCALNWAMMPSLEDDQMLGSCMFRRIAYSIEPPIHLAVLSSLHGWSLVLFGQVYAPECSRGMFVSSLILFSIVSLPKCGMHPDSLIILYHITISTNSHICTLILHIYFNVQFDFLPSSSYFELKLL